MPEDNRLEADSTQRVSQSLAELPDAPATPSKREIVARLASDIQSARNKGYTLKTIARHLQDRGFDINYNTLRDALPRQKKSRSVKKKPRAATADGARTNRDGLMTNRDGTRTDCDGPMTDRDGTRMDCDGPMTDCDGPMTNRDGTRTNRDGTRMRVVAPSNAPATREVAPAKSSRGAPDEPGRDAIPPGAFERRPDLKDL